ncbi:C69 family dipeptidase, partial [candidate division KSB1 bacterium]
WRILDLVAPSLGLSDKTINQDLPFSVKPDKKLAVKDVLKILRDKFEGTPYYAARGLHGGAFENPNRLPYGFTLDGKTYRMPRMTSVNRAECTAVTQCRDWLPNPVGGLVWIAFGAQDTDCFMPFYIGINKIPRSFEIGDHWEFNRESARWAFDYVDFHTQVVYSHAIKDVRAMQKKWEDGAIDRTKEIDEKASKLYKKSEPEMREFLTDYCNNNADLVINKWWKLGDDLLVKYNHLWMYNVKERSREALQYPEWWLRELVKYNGLKPLEEN